MGRKAPRQNLKTETSNLVRSIPKHAWNESKKEDYSSRGILSILYFCSFNFNFPKVTTMNISYREFVVDQLNFLIDFRTHVP